MAISSSQRGVINVAWQPMAAAVIIEMAIGGAESLVSICYAGENESVA
jgi:hypothetical protein